VDKKGRSASLMILGSLLVLAVHLSFALTYISPYFLMVILGIAFSLVPASMWPAVAKIVNENRIGTAYGLMFSLQNIGLWVFPILAGLILDNTNAPEGTKLDYTFTQLMFASLGLAGLVFALLLKRDDKISGFGLELPSNRKM
jgi:MFS family permease